MPLWASLLTAVLLAGFYTIICLWCQPNSLRYTLGVLVRQPLLIVLNALPVGLLILSGAFLLKNVFRSAALMGSFCAALSLVNRIKIEVRDEPFFPRDIYLLKEVSSAVTAYEIRWPLGIIAVILVLAAAMWMLGGYFRCQPLKLKGLKSAAVRGVGILSPLALLAGLVLTVYASNDLYNSFRVTNAYYVPSVFNELGFPYCFCHHFTTYTVDRPEGFDLNEAERWDSAEAAGSRENKDVHVIMVMNEAFSDLTDTDAFTYSAENDPLKVYHALQSSGQAFSGRLVVPSFAGGTANTEFDVLTGMRTQALSTTTTSSMRAVNRALDSVFRVFGEDDYATSYVHPGDNWFYNRENVFRWFGADETMFINAMPDAEYKGRWVTDAYMADLIEDRFERAVAGGDTVFSYVTTIQNHMSYTTDKYGADYTFPSVETSLSLSAEVSDMLAVYVEGVRDADAMLGQLVDYFSAGDEPVVLVFFGDHLPYLGDNQLAYRELGSDVALPEAQRTDAFASHEAPYLVWANDAAADILNWDDAVASLDLPEDGRLGACYLGQVILELTGRSDDSAWFAFLGEARRELPVIQPALCLTAEGSTVAADTLSGERQELIRKLQRWSYYKLKYKEVD